MFKKVRSIHFIGIGGIGMSGIAELLNNLGFKITGSDLVVSENVKRLETLGIEISIGHNANNLKDAHAVVYSSAVSLNNPEILSAIKNSIPVIRRAEMLGELINLKRTSIAVAGTHGKTTTSSMIGTILEKSGYDPTLVVGGLVSNLNTNVKLGTGEIIVVEADEFDRSFLALNPTIAIATNLEMEHTDCYKDINDIEEAFLQFCKSVPFYGTVILCADSEPLMKIMQEIKKPITTYGLSVNSDYCAKNIQYSKNKSKYNLFHKNKDLGEIIINVPGKHNVLNSLASITLGMELDVPLGQLKSGINSYTGVRRRFEIKNNKTGILVVDDYAHHPTEVIETIRAAKKGWNRRLITIFQPHLFSRTKAFYKDFAKALNESDIIILTDIYPAREKPQKNISSKLIFNEIKKHNHKNLFFLDNIENMNPFLTNIVKRNDMVLTMGAGTIWRYGQKFYDFLNK